MKVFFRTTIAITITCFIISGCSNSAVVQKSSVEVPKAQQNAGAQKAAPVDRNETITSGNEQLRLKKEVLEVEEATGEYQFADIHFDYDKYNLKTKERARLEKIADWLKINKSFAIRIEGHCDERGGAEYNIALGEKRAAAARNYLIRLGIPKERVSIISYGKEKPLDPGHNERAWAKNRRDNFVVFINK